jgi:protein-S-isoprenylcysteine O-methyltransferase Ste14
MTSSEVQKKESKISIIAMIYILRGLISTALACCLFFLAAGTWTIVRGWIYFITTAMVVFISNLIVAIKNPGLLDQRSKIRKGSKKWDKLWLSTFMIFFIYGMPFIAGYDIGRFGNQFNGLEFYVGIILFLISFILATWAMSVNKFFETSVRIQEDRGHYVIKDGPYKYVRHPGYSAMIFWVIGFPLFVGSQIALYVGLALLLGLALRTSLEDRTLQKELSGYIQYTREVRYRLIPFIW